MECGGLMSFPKRGIGLLLGCTETQRETESDYREMSWFVQPHYRPLG